MASCLMNSRTEMCTITSYLSSSSSGSGGGGGGGDGGSSSGSSSLFFNCDYENSSKICKQNNNVG